MNIKLPSARYIVAVSGGVDSVVLLDCLVESNSELVEDGRIIVAHFDHGIRKDSQKDALFVEELAQKYGLQFIVGHGGLGPNASEETARKARYDFLETVKKQNQADAIITAHHQDDVIETAIINVLRGTGRRGLTSLKERKGLLRPFLNYKKENILSYAKEKNLIWVEDETNVSSRYLRNRVRKLIANEKHTESIKNLQQKIEKIRQLNTDIDREIDVLMKIGSRKNSKVVPRKWFVKLNYDLACEVVLAQLRNIGAHEIDTKLVDMIVVFIKTGKIGKRLDIDKKHYLLLTKRSARYVNR